MDLTGLPNTRTSLSGLTAEGDEAWLIREIARKLYRCPGCHGDVEIGSEHVIVHYVRRLGGDDHHHWHRRCVEEILINELTGIKTAPAGQTGMSQLASRGRSKSGRRRRR